MSDPVPAMQRRFLITVVIGVTILFLWMVRSFLIALLMAAIFSAMSLPLYRRMTRWCRGRGGLAAGLTLVVLIIAVGLPMSGFVTLVVAQAIDITNAARPWIEQQIATPEAWSRLVEQFPLLGRLLPAETDVAAKLGEFAASVGEFLANSMVDVTRGTASFFLQLFVMLYAMYFFLVGGRGTLDRIIAVIPLDHETSRALVAEFVSVTKAVLKGSLIIGVIQGVLAGGAFWIAGIQGWAFWTTIMIVLSVIPAVGTGLIWIPAVIYLLASGDVTAGVLLAVWCAAVVGSVDNLLRPLLIGRDTKMPDLLVLVGTLGGLFLFGALGFIVGPIVAALFLSVWELYGTEAREASTV
jgi:predicted PurR-regulated permease PerM